MKDFKKEFGVYLTTEKKLSQNSYESYMRDISQFCSYCESKGADSVTELDNAFIKGYFKYLKKLGKSPSSSLRALASLRCYFTFLVSMEIIQQSPVYGIEAVKKEKKFPEILTNKEVRLLLSQPDASTEKGIRDKAMLETLYATGIRVSELISLKLRDVNVQIGLLHLNNDKTDRVIPMYPEAVQSVSAYISGVRNLLVYDRTVTELFVNTNGKPMTRQGFWKIIKYYAEKAGINKDITPHTLRHSFAEHLLENGAPLSDIKEILGHADISSTQMYAQMMKNKYAQSYKKYHPMA